MNAWRMLLVQPALERRLRRDAVVSLMLLATALIGEGWFVASPEAMRALGFLPFALGLLVTVYWWLTFLPRAILQNTPANAVLVPGLRRRLLVLAAGLCLAAGAVNAVMFGIATGRSGFAFVTTVTVLWLIAASLRSAWLLMPMLLASFLAAWYPAPLMAWFAGTAEWTGTLAILAAWLPLAGVTLLLLFPRGGDRHFAWRARAARLDLNMRKGPGAADGSDALGSVLRQPADLLYGAALDGRFGVRGRAGRLLDGLGPCLHWARPLGRIALGLLIMLAWGTYSRIAAGLGPFLLFALILPALTCVKTMTTGMKESSAEQALLRLTPAAPAPAVLNGEIGAALLRRFGVVWAGYLAASAVLAAVLVAPEARWMMWCCGAVIVAGCAPRLLRDYARTPEWTSFSRVFAAAVVVLPTLAGILPQLPHAPVYAGVLACLFVTLAGLRRQWRSMSAAPVGWPAGRLAA
ncbi:hypothetical protein IP91_01655 [Pseudoduganella lurida]|uniref:Uncharacterized protein n=1 Tax=Pseudoduganella lurida TaxID=1036180 RepID=A0A562REQ8_9BURK|nr:hypothetical protein [Pseudoduganella lurida]TWI67541.1 hypothetical protein IP91_01655 [Pseudoduganella lurida]